MNNSATVRRTQAERGDIVSQATSLEHCRNGKSANKVFTLIHLSNKAAVNKRQRQKKRVSFPDSIELRHQNRGHSFGSFHKMC